MRSISCDAPHRHSAIRRLPLTAARVLSQGNGIDLNKGYLKKQKKDF